MSRIRSTHPGLWTDEAFVALSPFARLLLMGIWNECDDMGAFEWSPLKLKMRLLPADAVDAAVLLEELAAAGRVLRYTVEGRALGAVRNFCRFQRPQKPNSVYPLTDEVRAFVALADRHRRNGSGAVPDQYEIAPLLARQREEGEKEESKGEGRAPAGETNPVETVPMPAPRHGSRLPSDFAVPAEWIDWAVAERRWSTADARTEAARFVDYWCARAGREGCKLDWQATWRNWVRDSRRPDGCATSAAKPVLLTGEAERAEYLRRLETRPWMSAGGPAPPPASPPARHNGPRPLGALLPQLPEAR